MKKMFFLIIISIVLITFFFLFYSSDINVINKSFLSAFSIEIYPEPVTFEEITIPKVFDNIYESYNFLQIQSGFDLSDYKGKNAVRYTYKVLNFPDTEEKEVYANVICIDNTPVGGDIFCPAIDGFMLPLNYLLTN